MDAEIPWRHVGAIFDARQHNGKGGKKQANESEDIFTFTLPTIEYTDTQKNNKNKKTSPSPSL